MWRLLLNIIAIFPIWSLVYSNDTTFVTPNTRNRTTIAPAVAYDDTSSASRTVKVSPMSHNKSSDICTVEAINESVRKNLSDRLEFKPKVVQIILTLVNGTLVDSSMVYIKPWFWVLTTGQQGQALLMLPFYYSQASFGILSIGEVILRVKIVDKPPGCLESLNNSTYMISIIRDLLLNYFKDLGITNSSEHVYMCIPYLKDKNGYGHFTYQCCRYGSDGSIICRYLEQGPWLSFLNILLILLQVINFLFSTRMLPTRLIADEYYKLRLHEPVIFNVQVTKNAQTISPAGAYILKQESPASLQKFRSKVVDLKPDIPVKMSVHEINVPMLKERVISRTCLGLTTYLYDNLIKCQIRNDPPNDAPCEENLFGKCGQDRCSQFTWINLLMLIAKIAILVVLPFPYYIRLYMYYMYEEREMRIRQAALEARNLRLPFEGNLVAYLSPMHPVFITIYIILVIETFGVKFVCKGMCKTFKDALSVSLAAMKNRTYVDKIEQGAHLLNFLRQKFGRFLACLIMIPVAIAGAVFYFVPIFYLTVQVVHYFCKNISEICRSAEKEFRHNDMGILLPGAPAQRLDYRGIVTNVLTELFMLLCTLATIYAGVIIWVVCCGFFLEVFVFTMMGMIVNAEVTMKYVSLAFFIAIYLYESYNSVYMTYKTLANRIIDEAYNSREENVDEEAYKAESMQENSAFVIQARDDVKPPRPGLKVIRETILSWEVERPLLFMDTRDELYVSKEFFKKFCQDTTAGCPGPVYVSLLKATLRFSAMFAVFAFVMIIVMVFSDEYSELTNNKLLATIAGGILPFFLQKMLLVKPLSLSISDSKFKYLYDNIVKDYSSRWEIFDLNAKISPAPIAEILPAQKTIQGEMVLKENLISTEKDSMDIIQGDGDDQANVPGSLTASSGYSSSPPENEDVDLVGFFVYL